MPRFSVYVQREKDYDRYKAAAESWAGRLGVRPRGKGVLSAYVRHLLERGERAESQITADDRRKDQDE